MNRSLGSSANETYAVVIDIDIDEVGVLQAYPQLVPHLGRPGCATESLQLFAADRNELPTHRIMCTVVKHTTSMMTS